MDPIFHFLFNYLLFNNTLIAIGGIFPDLLYILNILYITISLTTEKFTKNIQISLVNHVKNSYTQKNDDFTVLWIWGERLHSIFILPLIFLFLSLFTEIFLNFAIGIVLHIIVDFFSHKEHGPRFFWPIKDEYIRLGFFQWRTNIKVYTFLWALLLISLVFKFLISF